MQLPTDPESIAELERLMAEAETCRQQWLQATERVYDWLAEKCWRPESASPTAERGWYAKR